MIRSGTCSSRCCRDNRAATDTRTQATRCPELLAGILFVLTTGIAWQLLPQELGCGPGMTCWRGLREWHEAGVFDRLHQLLLAKLASKTGSTSHGRSVTPPRCVRSWGRQTGPRPVDDARAGSKYHLITDANGVPSLACSPPRTAERHHPVARAPRRNPTYPRHARTPGADQTPCSPTAATTPKCTGGNSAPAAYGHSLPN